MANMTTTPRRLAAALAIAAAALAACAHDHPAAAPAATTAAPTVAPTPQPPTADDRYVRLLIDSGWTVDDLAQLIRVAHSECSSLATGKSDAALAGEVARHYRITPQAARSQLTAAEATYCPQYLDADPRA